MLELDTADIITEKEKEKKKKKEKKTLKVSVRSTTDVGMGSVER